MRRSKPTRRDYSLALAVQSFKTARVWLIHWQNIEPTLVCYQEPVGMHRVLADHRGAIAAEPETTT